MENTSGNNQNTLVIVLVLLLLISFSAIIFLLIDREAAPASKTQSSSSGISVSELSPVPTVTKQSSTPIQLDRTYTFDINDRTGTKIGDFGYTIKDVQRTKEITIAGRTAQAVGDRELVILNIELKNSGNIPISVAVRNYLRLSVNGQDKQLAPDYHNDPVDLQPQSVEDVRLGFNIAQSDHSLVLSVGELTGQKDIIKLE